MNNDASAVRVVLRALADVKNEQFRRLCLNLPRRDFGFSIFQSARNDGVYVGVHASVMRDDGIDVCWSVVVEALDEAFIVQGSVEVTDDGGSHEVFSRESGARTGAEAAGYIESFATEVCAETGWLDDPEHGGRPGLGQV